VIAPGESVLSPARTLGDEPALIRRHVPAAFFGIAANRFMAGSLLAKQFPRAIFLLDDAFQHRQLARNLDIVIIDSSQLLGTNRVFPRGTLREPLSSLRRCHVVIINDSGNGNSLECLIDEVRRYHPHAAFYSCRQRISAMIPFLEWTNGTGTPTRPSGPSYVVTAIGNPERFKRSIRDLGVQICGTKYFRDHYRLKPKDWAECIEDAQRNSAAAIIVTEKDAIKMSDPPDFPVLVASQSTTISNAREFELRLKRCAEETS
jgi:tetraacyldisaccharide 4'-kinase